MPIRHTTIATFPDEPSAEINKAEWNADHTNPDIADVTGLQAALDAKGALTTVEKELGSVPKMAGKFTIAGTGLTIGKPVSVMKAVGPYTGKGTRADEAEMDAITATGVVTSATEITVYWNAATRVKGNVKFNYFVGA